jgi:MoxR-like ATPase
MPEHAQDFATARSLFASLRANLGQVIYGQERSLRWLLAAFSWGGHVLLEDMPGTGKTTLAKALAKSCRVEFQRIQFTPDLLPSDILGVSLFDQKCQDFRFEAGPIFCNILLTDEINRASPRTQSALLEAMAERQVSVERQARPLPEPFFVIATQNPVEFHGTYPLPEAQLDRFALRFGLGYVSMEQEVALLDAQALAHPLDFLQPCLQASDLAFLRQQVLQVRIGAELKRYIVEIVAATRHAETVKLPASPRASLTLMKCAQALSLLDGYDFVTPDAIRELAVPAIAHRLGLDAQSRFAGTTGEAVVRELLERIPVPV